MQGIFLVVTFLVIVIIIMTEFEDEDEDSEIRNDSSLWITRKNTEEDEIL
jgi:Na+-transporting methylmalonyl-CoA/oxaloacetate decarboxylase gamma subunit